MTALLQDLKDTVAQIGACAAEMRRLKGVSLCDDCTLAHEGRCRRPEGLRAAEEDVPVYSCPDSEPDDGTPYGPGACESCGNLEFFRQSSEAWGRVVYEELTHCRADEYEPEPGRHCPEWAKRQEDR